MIVHDLFSSDRTARYDRSLRTFLPLVRIGLNATDQQRELIC